MPKLILTILLIIAGFCVNAQTKDSTYKTTHDSILVKKTAHQIKMPYDSSYWIKQLVDTTISHDSTYRENYDSSFSGYKPVVFQTTHDSSVIALFPFTARTRHDSTYWRCPPRKQCSWVTITVRHDTTKYTLTAATISVTHDTTFLLKYFDTAHLVKDSIGLFTHDSLFLRNVLIPHIAYKDSIIFLDSFYIAKTTHDTTVQVTIPQKVIVFGAKLQGSVDNQITALKKLGVKGVRTSVILKDFTGIEKSLDTYINEGFIPAVNLRWTNVVPSPFCTDTNAYKVKEKLFLDKYAAKIIAAGGFILCENEPMNLGYYGTAPIEDYITLLRLFVRVAQPYNINTSDGCLFVEYLNLEATKGYLITDRFGNTDTMSRLKDKIITQRKLLTAYKTIPLTFINVHLGIHDDVLETDMIKNSLDYLRVQTGKNDIVTNEYHYETCTGSSGITNKTIAEWKKAGVLFCYVWSGDQLEGEPATGGNSPAMALSLDINLTELGVSQANAIK